MATSFALGCREIYRHLYISLGGSARLFPVCQLACRQQHPKATAIDVKMLNILQCLEITWFGSLVSASRGTEWSSVTCAGTCTASRPYFIDGNTWRISSISTGKIWVCSVPQRQLGTGSVCGNPTDNILVRTFSTCMRISRADSFLSKPSRLGFVFFFQPTTPI